MNVKGNLHLLREALPTFKENPDGGVFLITSSIAVNADALHTKISWADVSKGIAQSGSTMAYSVTKAAGRFLP